MREYFLELFYERLPRKPYGGRKDKGRFHLCVRPRERAVQCPYIQVGHYPHGIMRIALDVDNGRFMDVAQRLPPSAIVAAPGTAHVIYEFSSPFPPAPSPKSARLLRFLRRGLTALYHADPAYTGLLAKNPLNPPEGTEVLGAGKMWDGTTLAYELSGLTSEADIHRYYNERTPEAEAGRNVTLFHSLRYWAYEQVAMYRGLPGGRTAFKLQVEQHALQLNFQLFADHPRGPLDSREVGYIAKSVAKWVWTRYRLPLSAAGHIDRSRLSREEREKHPPLSEEAARRGHRLGGRIKGKENLMGANRKRRAEAEHKLAGALARLEERGSPITVRALAREAGVAVNTAKKFLKRKK